MSIECHHGTCDECKKRHVIVYHFGYPMGYRVCRECMAFAVFEVKGMVVQRGC